MSEKLFFEAGEISHIKVDSSKYKMALKNMQITPLGGVECIGYKTLRDFIKILKSQNKILTRNNTKVKFEVILPLPK